MAQATTYNTAGNREDLTDWLTILEPEDCPKTSTFNKTKAPTNRLQEWQADSLANVDFSGVREGEDVTAFNNETANRARFGNYIQKFRRPWMVSDEEEATDVAGVGSEVAVSKTKAAREVKRSIEAAVGSDNDMQADNGAIPYKTRGLGKWIQATAQTVNPVPAAFLTPSANISTVTSGAFTETGFNDVFQSIFQQNGGRRNYTLFAGPTLKRAISKFQRQEGSTVSKGYMVTTDGDTNKIELNVTVYDGDFHSVTIIPDLFNGVADGAAITTVTTQQQCRGYVIDPQLVGVGYMIGLNARELENQGGGRRGFVGATLALVCKNPRGLGKFSGAT